VRPVTEQRLRICQEALVPADNWYIDGSISWRTLLSERQSVHPRRPRAIRRRPSVSRHLRLADAHTEWPSAAKNQRAKSRPAERSAICHCGRSATADDRCSPIYAGSPAPPTRPTALLGRPSKPLTWTFGAKNGWARRDLNPHAHIPYQPAEESFSQVEGHFYYTDGYRSCPLRTLVSCPGVSYACSRSFYWRVVRRVYGRGRWPIKR